MAVLKEKPKTKGTEMQEVPDLPPLPEPDEWQHRGRDHAGRDVYIGTFSSAQMQAYAREALTQAVADAQRTLARVLEIASFNPNRTDDQSILRGRLLQIQDVVREAMR